MDLAPYILEWGTRVFLCRVLNVSHNYLTGAIPSSVAGFNSSAFDYNCLANCSLVSQLRCRGRTPESQTAALSALYDGTGGPRWARSLNWTVGDPCVDRWDSVACTLKHSSCGPSNVTCVGANSQVAQSLFVPCA